jgi:hypothetical protein
MVRVDGKGPDYIQYMEFFTGVVEQSDRDIAHIGTGGVVDDSVCLAVRIPIGHV